LKSLLRFLSVGSVGFLVDAGVLLVAMMLGAGPYAGRAVSIGIAAVTTWRLNRRYTFAASGLSEIEEGARYFSGVALGSGLNYTIYALLIGADLHPIGSLIVASGLVMAFSYAFYRFVVFAGFKPN